MSGFLSYKNMPECNTKWSRLTDFCQNIYNKDPEVVSLNSSSFKSFFSIIYYNNNRYQLLVNNQFFHTTSLQPYVYFFKYISTNTGPTWLFYMGIASGAQHREYLNFKSKLISEYLRQKV